MTEQEIINNKNEFIEIIKSIDLVEGDRVEELVNYLEAGDFFEAPCSTKYHLNEKGGLCKHSLNVYNNMMILKNNYYPELPEDSIKRTALLHDIAKTDFYKVTSKNEKVYSPKGTKQDALGKFDWVSSYGYSVKDPADRDVILGEHGVNSYAIISRFLHLTQEEACAIINHHAGLDNKYVFSDLNEAMNRYPTLTLLHLADMLSTYITENPYMISDTEETSEDE